MNKIKIINTYVPRMGYNIGEITKYWSKGSIIMKKINHNGRNILCTDNNGEISHIGERKYR